MAEGVNRVVICASPRARGCCAQMAAELRADLARRFPGDEPTMLYVCEALVAGCLGCGRCQRTGACFQRDDMDAFMEALDAADELHLVVPVYFAGPPSQFKAVLDRLQPHYWKGTRFNPKRPAHLQVVGDGGDPHGFEPLVTICRSALAVAGFRLETVTAHIGPQEAPAEDGAAASASLAAPSGSSGEGEPHA